MHFIKSRNCRRRKIHTLGILLIIVVIYFFLQFFSLSHLGSESKRKKKPHLKVVNVNPETNVHDDEAKSNNNHEPARNSDKLVDREKEEQVSVPRGVLSHDAAQYTKDSLGQFKCLKSELYIPAERVNDNFCDCPDSSDEPGTSACPSGRFYCRVQLPHQNAQFVHSSKVNDGICDCCDGSDEWKGQQVPAPVQLRGKKGAVFQTPCENHCGDLLQLMEHEEKIRRQGVLLQKQYLEAARSLSPKHLHQFGPQGIFYLLSKECYQHAAHEYLYTICPFNSVQQSQGALSKTVLGRQGQWSQLKPGDYILDMLGGDARLCPDGKSRETQIRFLCGLEDRVINVSEDQKCRYVVRFSSPAAC